MPLQPSIHSELPDIPKSEGHLVWGTTFSIDPQYIEGAKGETLTITPEVVNLREADGTITTLIIRHHISPAIEVNGQQIAQIDLGSFGQNDPFRMWVGAKSTGNILTDIPYIQEIIRREGGLLNLEELLYIALNAAFIAKPFTKYDDGNIHNHIDHSDIPQPIIQEIMTRIFNNEPLNYLYLFYLISESFPDLLLSDYQTLVQTRAKAQFQQGEEHSITLRGKNPPEYQEIYTNVMANVDFNIEIKDGLSISREDISLLSYQTIDTSNWHITSNIPIVNITYMILRTLTYLLERQERSIVVQPLTDRIRLILVQRIYSVATTMQPESLHGMTLGEFASATYELMLNNNDHNLNWLIINLKRELAAET